MVGRVLAESVGSLVPGQLATDAVRDGGDKLAPDAQLGAQFQCKLFGIVGLFGHVPLELVHQRDVAHVDVKLKGRD